MEIVDEDAMSGTSLLREHLLVIEEVFKSLVIYYFLENQILL